MSVQRTRLAYSTAVGVCLLSAMALAGQQSTAKPMAGHDMGSMASSASAQKPPMMPKMMTTAEKIANAVASAPPSLAAKATVVDWPAKDGDKPVVKAGLIGDRLYDTAAIKQLASLPPRDVLLAQVLGTITAPLSSFLGAVNALVASPAQLAAALEDKQKG